MLTFISCKVKRNKPCPGWCLWSRESPAIPRMFPLAPGMISQPTPVRSLCSSGRGQWHEGPEMEKTAFPNDQVLMELLWKSTLWRQGIKPNPTVVALLGRGLCTAHSERGNHLHSNPAGVLNTPPPLPGLPMALKPNPVPILFGKHCYFVPNIPLQGWHFPQQLQCHVPVTSNTRGSAGRVSCTPFWHQPCWEGLKILHTFTVFLHLLGKHSPGQPLPNNISPLANKRKSKANYLLPNPLPSL